MWVEVAGVLVRQVNARNVSAREADDALTNWTTSSAESFIKCHASRRDLIDEAARIAIRLGHPLKDCVYLALAMRLDAELVTCDVRFRDRAVASYPRVRLLAKYC